MSSTTDESTHIDEREWHQRWEQAKGFPQPSIRPGEYYARSLSQRSWVVWLLVLIAVFTGVSMAMDIWARVEAERVQGVVSEALGESESASGYGSYGDCLADPDTTAEECDAAFPS